MTETEVKNFAIEKFKGAGLLPFLAERQQQCLEFPQGFFVEVVLTDGSKLDVAEQLMEDVQDELRERGIKVDYVVRALWRVEEVREIGPPRAESGGIKAALRFQASLRSGPREELVEVDLSSAAEQELRSRLDKVDAETLKRLVENFLNLELSTGGASYWDPMRYRHLDISGAAVLYLLHHSPMTAA